MALKEKTYIEKVLNLAKNWPVFPCVPFKGNYEGHKPKAPLTINGFKDATKNPEKIKQWWEKHPNALVGVPTGSVSGFWVVDADLKVNDSGVMEHGEETLRNYPELPATLSQNTQGGGKHYFFKWDPARPIRSHTNKLGKCLDIRGNGGYVIVTPSAGYTRDTGSPTSIAIAPDWLFDVILNKAADKVKNNNTAVVKKPIIEKEELSRTLFTIDPKEHQDRTKWMNIMMAVHDACHGESYGKELFIHWSLQDNSQWKEDPVHYIEKMWPTLSSRRDVKITYGSLVHMANPLGIVKQEFSTIDGVTKLEGTWDGSARSGLKATIRNTVNFLTRPTYNNKEIGLEGLFAWDSFMQKTVFVKSPPWDSGKDNQYYNKELQDSDVTFFRHYLNNKFSYVIDKINANDGILIAAQQNQNHPVRNYLKSVKWDKVSRIDKWLNTYGGAPFSKYCSLIGPKFLISAVARVFEPGCKVDTMLVLEGDQGAGKSTMVEIIGRGWSSKPQLPVGEKDAIIACTGSWIIEIEEMECATKADTNALKKFISCGIDRFRNVFGIHAVNMPRQFVFVGTINPNADGQYLKDATGNRRFWPIKIKKVNFKTLIRDIDQLWAEAYYRYKQKETWHLAQDQEHLAIYEQDKRRTKHPWEEPIFNYLYCGGGITTDYISAIEILENVIGIPRPKISRRESNIVGPILHKLGWEIKTIRVNSKTVSRFIRPALDSNDPLFS